MKNPIAITAISSVSPIGNSLEQAWEAYQNKSHYLKETSIGNNLVWAGKLPKLLNDEIKALASSDSKYKNLDASVLYGIYAARKAVEQADWSSFDNFGINLGSSRGATELFEKFHEEFLKEDGTSTLASPTTTLGNISSWVAHDLKTKGPEISHSITCSTALHAMLNGVAWINSGMTDKFLVGGSEAPLTPFTIAQMKALKIYSKDVVSFSRSFHPELVEGYPCRAHDLEKTKNTMVLGEGASVACLENGNPTNSLAKIIGVGYATEPLIHNVSISTDAKCFQDSMEMALDGKPTDNVDVIVMHAPGTVKGDLSEVNAIKKVFCNKRPFLTTNKWKVGHTFGASGMLSVEMAILMLQKQEAISVPFAEKQESPKSIKSVLVNAVGFGGNAVSILLSK
ncbi:beta-ketoacyl synthase N-terminal-like domain-containing protein [Croceitalea sp. MTPC9]|uniref:beta-ketoacyl synthase N-terminal-like domain-containing protein n=1 Tax=unclassified Croceitalea TaxID=2632280 RepID=UPI002B3A5D9E|nr:beta-ketoacyl synthase N-terminal-like domain-containing protein [Croceitalea sp. MTPC6]GMN16868.1 beta-ketoacyl synthase N-terminal-like domain-containing protein [Croceitalea sp. MTPC9]